MLAHDRDYDDQLDAWNGWHSVATPMRKDYQRFVELVNQGARDMGYADAGTRLAGTTFEADYRHKTALNRRILDHLLHDAFGDDARTEPEVDLVLDPDPPREKISDVLAHYGFRDVEQAYRNLMDLASEKLRFLSTRRCRMT